MHTCKLHIMTLEVNVRVVLVRSCETDSMFLLHILAITRRWFDPHPVAQVNSTKLLYASDTNMILSCHRRLRRHSECTSRHAGLSNRAFKPSLHTLDALVWNEYMTQKLEQKLENNAYGGAKVYSSCTTGLPALPAPAATTSANASDAAPGGLPALPGGGGPPPEALTQGALAISPPSIFYQV